MTAPAAVVLVEGRSDLAAVRAAATVLGVDLDAAGIDVVAMDGVTNLLRALTALPTGARPIVLADGAEEPWVRRALARIPDPPPVLLCDRDLEDELLAALGDERALAVLEEAGDLAAFRVFAGQPAQRDRSERARLHRFVGTASGRKERMAAAFTAALGAGELPPPLAGAIRGAMAAAQPRRARA